MGMYIRIFFQGRPFDWRLKRMGKKAISSLLVQRDWLLSVLLSTANIGIGYRLPAGLIIFFHWGLSRSGKFNLDGRAN
jgi:hypothetical protein